ncbi:MULTISPECIES: CobQ/CobB/MinD/ParA nucleotide binding domain-containing protein [Rhodomicrobium]|uniref:CobQ/CobB/MinD/ParA nucleotide binding domain-containing protein n=1 Tax=Rhodomicrobium TaxID=1068 RepID=UPI000B4AB7A4|nr:MULTISPECIES: CobQ/CobB/MinD/ParA nucleotide binding domain-containing protein [Rhodomicrobium]
MVRQSALRGDQQVDILLVSEDVELKEMLAKGFAEKKHFVMRTVKGTVANTEKMLGMEGVPGVLLVDLKSASPEDLAALERIKRGRFAATPIIAISSYLDQEIVRRLVQIKVDDWLPKDSPFVDIYRSCERLNRTPQVEGRNKDAVCYSFFPASGGAGNTTLAIQTAFQLGRTSRDMASTCLVDLNFQDGSIADYLDIAPAFRIEELANAPGRLDGQLLDVMLTRHSSGLSVLATPRVPAKYFEISEGLIGAVLGLLSRSFDNVVIDLPKNWYPWTDNVIWGSNQVYVVTNFTVPALRHARYMIDAISAKIVNDAKVSVIVNKHRESMFGAGLKKSDAEQMLRNWLAGFIPDAPDLVQEAINRGVPISDINRGSKVEKALERILKNKG